jgi:hypothetical protein
MARPSRLPGVEQDEPLLLVSSDMTDIIMFPSPAASIPRDIAVGENEAAPVGAQLTAIATQ